MRGFTEDSRCITPAIAWSCQLGKHWAGLSPLANIPRTTATGVCFVLAELLIFRAAVLFYTEKIKVKGRLAQGGRTL